MIELLDKSLSIRNTVLRYSGDSYVRNGLRSYLWSRLQEHTLLVCLVIAWTVEKFQAYIHSGENLETDHKLPNQFCRVKEY